MKSLALVALVVGALCVGVWAEVPPGIGSVAFARLGVDARALGMGGAFVGVAVGAPVAVYNPAALSRAERVDVSTMYATPYGFTLGITYQHASAVLPIAIESLPQIGAAITWMSLQIDDIMIWDEESPNPESFTATDSIYMASAGVEVADGLRLGATAKLYRERILDGRGQGVGFDLGGLATFDIEGIPVSLGVNSQDVGSTLIKWSGTAGNPDNFVTWVNKVGASVWLEDFGLLVATDVDWAIGRPASEQVFRAGAEWLPVDLLAVRAGWKTFFDGRSSVSLGIGIRLFDTVSLDYAAVLGGSISAAHFASLHVEF